MPTGQQKTIVDFTPKTYAIITIAYTLCFKLKKKSTMSLCSIMENECRLNC